MNVYGVIMAGGGGTRFWPLSRKKLPKQLLNLTGEEIMINEAINRLSYITENIYIVTNKEQTSEMLKVVNEKVPEQRILSEPSARNTTACIGYAAVELLKKCGDGVMIITPSDHYIKDTAAFTRVLNTAVNLAEKTDKLITIGIKPTFASTGFGYIKFDQEVEDVANKVAEFKEKPDEETAQKYVLSEKYLWNSGIFVWKASAFLECLKEFSADIYADLLTIESAIGTENENSVIEMVYPKLRKISVDYAVMEPAADEGRVLVIPGDFGWNDVGSWDMMTVLHSMNSDGNVCMGDVIPIDTTNSIMYSQGRTIATVGVDNLVIVETQDAVLVCKKDKAQEVRLVVEALEKEGRNELL